MNTTVFQSESIVSYFLPDGKQSWSEATASAWGMYMATGRVTPRWSIHEQSEQAETNTKPSRLEKQSEEGGHVPSERKTRMPK